uniref:Uncharacterized protein n=1 Tax=Rhizophagus irregularis (strain DAOM 181602 / DAOM 197198 / MUCL 43194) TaxID=747089 RepID=U9TMP7_RHIID
MVLSAELDVEKCRTLIYIVRFVPVEETDLDLYSRSIHYINDIDKYEYITKEYRFDINDVQCPNLSSTLHSFTNTQHPATIEKEIRNDFTQHPRKRVNELNTETQYRKHVKTGDAELES